MYLGKICDKIWRLKELTEFILALPLPAVELVYDMMLHSVWCLNLLLQINYWTIIKYLIMFLYLKDIIGSMECNFVQILKKMQTLSNFTPFCDAGWNFQFRNYVQRNRSCLLLHYAALFIQKDLFYFMSSRSICCKFLIISMIMQNKILINTSKETNTMSSPLSLLPFLIFSLWTFSFSRSA